MKIQNTNNFNFKGHGACRLQSLVGRKPSMEIFSYFSEYPNIVKKLVEIGKKEGFDVFTQTQTEIVNNTQNVIKRSIDKNPNEDIGLVVWAQDFLTFLPKKRTIAACSCNGSSQANQAVGELLDMPVIEPMNHIPGGNMYFIEEGEKTSLIIGKNSLYRNQIPNLQRLFGVDNVYPLSQSDFHIDLSIRPLKNKVVLAEDQQMMLDVIAEGIQKAEEYLKKHPWDDDVDYACRRMKRLLDEMRKAARRKLCEFRADDKIVQRDLENYGFTVVKVPGAITTWLPYLNEPNIIRNSNFLNAIVHERENGSLVYITNSADESQFGLTPEVIRKIGFSIEEKFKQSVSEYINPDNIHFIDIGNILRNKKGGIHCLFAEQPLIK